MIPKDYRYKNLSVQGKLTTGKLSVSQNRSEMSASIVAVGNTIFKRVFSPEELPDPDDFYASVDYTLYIDSSRSMIGDRLSLFFVTPFRPLDGDDSEANLRIVMPESIYLVTCGEPFPVVTDNYRIYYQNRRFLLRFVFNGEKFVSSNDTY